jgi:uncharacterized LabA/DUF88 family protein
VNPMNPFFSRGNQALQNCENAPYKRRLVIFIDNSYLFRNLLEKNLHIDHQLLVNFLAFDAIEHFHLERVILYGSLDESDPDKIKSRENFYKKLSKLPKFQTEIYKLKIIRDNNGGIIEKKEKCVDCAIATGLVKYSMIGLFDTAIIVAGDADFVPPVKVVIDQGQEVIVAGFDNACSEILKEHALGYISLTQNLNKFVDFSRY